MKGFDWQKFGVWIGGRLWEVVVHGLTVELCLRTEVNTILKVS